MTLLQLPGGVELLFIGAIMLLFVAVLFAIIGGFVLVRRDRSPDKQRLDRLEEQMEQLQRRVDRLEE